MPLPEESLTIWSCARRAAVLCLLFASTAAVAAPVRIQRGMTLVDALRQFQQAGVNLIFTTRIVGPEMRVTETPRSGDARAVLTAILEPHSLTLQNGPNGSLIIVRARAGIAVPANKAAPASPPITVTDEIVVESQGLIRPTAAEGVLELTHDEIEALPHIGDEPLRALDLLPGTTTQDTSAEIQLRGARRDEVLIRLDGQELYRPYHLRDFDNTLSIIGASTLDRIDLINAPPVPFGDRAAGVIDMTTRAPSSQPHLRITMSMLESGVQAASAADSGRLHWNASYRHGTTDVIGRAIGTIAPSFSDAFAKADYQPSANQTLVLHELASRDAVRLSESDESKHLHTEYLEQYSWLSHAVMLTPHLYADTVVSSAHTSQDRSGAESDSERSFLVTDDRRLAATGLHQRWNLEAGASQTLGLGFEYDLFHAFYDYAGTGHFDTPLAALRSDKGTEDFALKDHFDQQRVSAYAFDQIRPAAPLMIEVGLRYDEYTVDHDSRMNPRLSAAWSRNLSTFHIDWGEYSQSHRPYELMVEDGDPHFYPSEHSRQWTAGVERIIPALSRLPIESVRADVYQRTVSTPRPRYRNLFDTFDPFPEGQFDRIRVAPADSTFEGLEISVRGRATPRIRWWLNYALASARDEFAGREIARETDQRHTINAGVNIATWHRWNVNAAWTFHSGWPETPITTDGQAPLLGPLNSGRLPNYHRLDVRLSRDWTAAGGVLTFYVEGRNVYNHRNVAGLDVKLDSGTLTIGDERWPGSIAIAGAAWRWR